MTEWWYYVVAVFAVAFTVNGIPHYIHGISGKQFPTPFSGGAGTLDTPLRNVLWGGGNLIVGGVLLWVIRDSIQTPQMITELVVLAIVLGALLGKALSREKRAKP